MFRLHSWIVSVEASTRNWTPNVQELKSHETPALSSGGHNYIVNEFNKVKIIPFQMVVASRLILGLFMNILMWTMISLDIFVLTCIFKSRLYAKKENSVYILASFNIIANTLHLILHITYTGPAILAGSWLFDGQAALGVTVYSVIWLGFWYLGSLTQILFATNRFVVAFFPQSVFLSQKRVLMFIVLFCFAAATMSTYSQLLSPCCRITIDPFKYSISYLHVPNSTWNPSMWLVDLPLDSCTSTYCGISYIALLTYVYKSSSADKVARKRELKCCIQFIIMFLTYAVVWLTFFLYPALDMENEEAYSVTMIALIFDCGVNAIVYLVLNNEVRTAANSLLGRRVFSVGHCVMDMTTAS